MSRPRDDISPKKLHLRSSTTLDSEKRDNSRITDRDDPSSFVKFEARLPRPLH